MADGLETFVRSIADLDRAAMIRALERKGAQLERAAKAQYTRRTGRRSPDRGEGYREVARVDRLLFLLRHGSPANAQADALDDLLIERLRARDEW